MSERTNDDWTPRDWGKPQPASEDEQIAEMRRIIEGIKDDLAATSRNMDEAIRWITGEAKQ